MEVRLAYGRDGLSVNLPDHVEVIRPAFVPGVPDEMDALQKAMRSPTAAQPLSDLVRPGDRVVVVHTDITRAILNTLRFKRHRTHLRVRPPQLISSPRLSFETRKTGNDRLLRRAT